MRKVYLVPNLVTTANMFCGYYAVIAAFHGRFVEAAWSIGAAAVFDGLDGRLARMARATSAFGVQYDSLSDLVSFGFAPSILIYRWALEPFSKVGYIAAFTFLVCAALRLARFNVNAGVFPKKYFQGLPSPPSALMIASTVIFANATGLEGRGNYLVLAMTVTLAVLMVSSIPFPSFKELNWRSRASFRYLLIGVAALGLIAAKPEISIFAVIGTYIVLTLSWYGYCRAKGIRVVDPKAIQRSPVEEPH